MKKFFGLIQNELIKIWKQTGYRVMLVVLVGLSCVTPLLGLLTTIDFGETTQDEYEMYTECAQEEGDTIYGKYYQAHADSIMFFIENGLADSWQYDQFSINHMQLYIRAVAAQLFEAGELTLDNIEKSPFDMYLGYSYYDNTDIPDDTVFPEGTSGEVAAPDSKYDIPTYAEAKAELDALSARILTVTEQDVALMYLETQAGNVQRTEEELELAQMRYDAKPNDPLLEYQLNVAKEKVRASKLALESCQARYDNAATPNGWAYSIHYLLTQCLDSMVSCVPTPEAIYEGEDYGDYLSECERRYDYYNEAAAVYLHSIKTNNCVSSLSDGSMLNSLMGGLSFGVSTKTQLRTALVSAVNFAAILMVVLASGIISTEFSSGTIRLLVIRPCTRRQIMSSKLAALGVVYVAVVIAMSLILTVETVLFFGIGDLFAPDIVYIAGNTVDLPFFVMTLERIAVSSLAALAYTAVAIILASLTRKNGLAITMSMLVYAFGSTVATVVIALVQVFPNAFGWAVYTPPAYMSLTSIVPPAHELMSGMGGMFGMSGAELWIGVLYHIVFIAGMVYLTVLAFIKKQIKN